MKKIMSTPGKFPAFSELFTHRSSRLAIISYPPPTKAYLLNGINAVMKKHQKQREALKGGVRLEGEQRCLFKH